MAITDITITNDTIAEGVSNGTFIGIFNTVNDDTNEMHTFTIIDDADKRFQLYNNSLIVRDTTKLDYETDQSHDIEIRVTDTQGNTFDKIITIYVTDADTAAIIRSITPSTSQIGTNPEVVINGQHFAEGGEPIVRIDGEPVSINSFTDTEIRFVLTDDLSAGVYKITVFNGLGL